MNTTNTSAKFYAKNAVTGLYFNGACFKATKPVRQFDASEIAVIKATWANVVVVPADAFPTVTNVRRAGRTGDQILADVDGATEFVRKSGGAKYSYISVQIGRDGAVHLQANRTAKATPYSSWFQVVKVLPIAG